MICQIRSLGRLRYPHQCLIQHTAAVSGGAWCGGQLQRHTGSTPAHCRPRATAVSRPGDPQYCQSDGCLTVCPRVPVTHSCYSTTTSPVHCCSLEDSRTLVRVSGSDATLFLQGLVTNDMRLLQPTEGETSLSVMYTLMLNVQGRLMYDLLVYRLNNTDNSYLIECNKDVCAEFISTLKKYKIRKKVDISPVGEEYKVWAVFPSQQSSSATSRLQLSDPNCAVCYSPDPRLPSLGSRLILPADTDGPAVVGGELAEAGVYIRRRYELGIGEGVLDLPPATSLPLESNVVFLNGVSFSKGCYIGQELTARTHHTGVIRKRLMPVTLSSSDSAVEPGQTMENSRGKKCGKLRNTSGEVGLALLRVLDVVGQGPLLLKDKEGQELAQCNSSLPTWWPTDSDEIIKQALKKLGS